VTREWRDIFVYTYVSCFIYDTWELWIFRGQFFTTDLGTLCSNCKRRTAAQSCHHGSLCEMMSRIKSTIAYKYWMRTCVHACMHSETHAKHRRQSQLRMLSTHRKRTYVNIKETRRRDWFLLIDLLLSCRLVNRLINVVVTIRRFSSRDVLSKFDEIKVKLRVKNIKVYKNK